MSVYVDRGLHLRGPSNSVLNDEVRWLRVSCLKSADTEILCIVGFQIMRPFVNSLRPIAIPGCD
jgi:hypothetical protein